MFLRTILLLSTVLLFNSCTKKTEAVDPVPEGEGTYFSIMQFTKDQWDTHHGQPFSLSKTVYLNGEVDSTLTDAFKMDWGSIFKVFFATDISDKKFLGQYDFTMFEDDMSVTRNFYYEAKNEKLFTRKFQISADQFTNKIKSIYIETEKKGSWNTITQKLFYIPLKVISIQEYEWSSPGNKKEMRVEYRFL